MKKISLNFSLLLSTNVNFVVVECVLGDSVGVVVTRFIDWEIEEYQDSLHKEGVYFFSKLFRMILGPKQPCLPYYLKFLTLFVVFIGGWLGYEIARFLLGDKFFFYIFL